MENQSNIPIIITPSSPGKLSNDLQSNDSLSGNYINEDIISGGYADSYTNQGFGFNNSAVGGDLDGSYLSNCSNVSCRSSAGTDIMNVAFIGSLLNNLSDVDKQLHSLSFEEPKCERSVVGSPGKDYSFPGTNTPPKNETNDSLTQNNTSLKFENCVELENIMTRIAELKTFVKAYKPESLTLLKDFENCLLNDKSNDDLLEKEDDFNVSPTKNKSDLNPRSRLDLSGIILATSTPRRSTSRSGSPRMSPSPKKTAIKYPSPKRVKNNKRFH